MVGKLLAVFMISILFFLPVGDGFATRNDDLTELSDVYIPLIMKFDCSVPDPDCANGGYRNCNSYRLSGYLPPGRPHDIPVREPSRGARLHQASIRCTDRPARRRPR